MTAPDEHISGLHSRLNQLQLVCESVIRDEKPLSPKYQLDQMARMHAGFFVTDAPSAYTTSANEAREFNHMSVAERADRILHTKGVFPTHALSRSLIDETDQLAKKLAARGVQNIRLLGADYAARQVDFMAVPEFEQAEAYILGKSDFYGQQQFAALVKRRLEGQDPHPEKPIILHNYKSYWAPLIKGLGLTGDTAAKLEDQNIFVSSHLSQLRTLCEKHGQAMATPSQPVPNFLSIKPGSTILVATRQNRKIHELQSVFDALGANIRVLPFHIVVGRPREAEEASRTYIGNNIEKRDAAQEKLESSDRDQVQQNLKRHNISFDENTLVLFDDRGEEFETDFFAEPEFDIYRKHLNPYKRGLGVEMANFLRAVANADDMYHLINKVYDRLEAEGKKPTLNAFDYACYAIAPINDLSKAMVVTATTEDQIMRAPEILTKIGYSEDHLGLKSDAQGRSKNQTPNFLAKYSSMALAIGALSRISGLDAARDLTVSTVPNMATDYAYGAYDNRQGRWKIGLPQSSALQENFGKAAGGVRAISKRFTRQFDIVSGRKAHDLSVEHTYSVTMADGAVMPWYSSMVSAAKFAADVDAFYFRPLGKASSMMDEFARDFSFWTPIVGKQTFGPDYHSKPNVIDLRYAKRQVENYDHLHKLGMIGDPPKFVRHDVRSKSEALRHINKEMKHYVRPTQVETPLSIEGEVPAGLFKVTVYASASNRTEQVNKDAVRLGALAAEHGFDAINGGGNDGLMKSFADGVIKYRAEEKARKPEKIVVNGLTSIQCIDTIESEGEYPHADRKERHPTIFHRMDNLQKNDAEIFLAGGAGTLQEFYATAMDRLRTGKIENRPLILINQTMKSGTEELKVWSQLIASLPPGAEAAVNIHIVNNVDEAMDVCLEARTARGMQKQVKLNPDLNANDNLFVAPPITFKLA